MKKCFSCKHWKRKKQTKWGECSNYYNDGMDKFVYIEVAGGYANPDEVLFSDVFGCILHKHKN